MLKKFLMAGCAFASIATNATALTTPERVSSGPNGDPHIVKVEWHDGGMIQLIASLGQTLAIEMPKGTTVDMFLASDNDVMTKRPPPESAPGTIATAGKPTEPANQDNPCSETSNVQICVLRNRYVFVKPLTELNPQSLALLMTRKGAKETIENVAMFLIETTPHPERVYYSVKVTMPQVVPAVPATSPTSNLMSGGPTPAPARRPVAYVPRIPSLAQSQPQPTPPPINSAYSVEGDRRLVGVNR